MNMRITYDNSAYNRAKSQLPKPDGKHCIICGKDLPKSQRKYCGRNCWDNWYVGIPHHVFWGEVRLRVLQRDDYTCQKCGKQNLQYNDQKVDHIVPVSMGGDNFDMKNLQTLCHECHVAKTRRDMERLDEANLIPLLLRDFYGLVEQQERNRELWETWGRTGPSLKISAPS